MCLICCVFTHSCYRNVGGFVDMCIEKRHFSKIKSDVTETELQVWLGLSSYSWRKAARWLLGVYVGDQSVPVALCLAGGRTGFSVPLNWHRQSKIKRRPGSARASRGARLRPHPAILGPFAACRPVSPTPHFLLFFSTINPPLMPKLAVSFASC